MYFDIAKEKFVALQKNAKKQDINILAIESSCDETSIAVVRNGRTVLSNVISSQIEIHKRFGGVVPEVASRNHLLAINNVLSESLEKANLTLNAIHAIAVTYGAGLVGALLVGVNFAKSLAFSLNLPLIGVNHIKGHVSANYIAHENLVPPFMCLIVSGGHTALVKVEDYITHTVLGTTVDDAIGEAYDKVAKVLGLGYPGGPIIDSTAKLGNKNITFVKKDVLKNSLNFSYSGLKTAVVNYIHNANQKSESINVADVCCSFQCEAVDVLVQKSIRSCLKNKMNTIAIAGGVAANSYLRKTMQAEGNKNGVTVLFPPMVLCTDNAAMIGCEAYYNIISEVGLCDLTLNAKPNINLKYSVERK